MKRRLPIILSALVTAANLGAATTSVLRQDDATKAISNPLNLWSNLAVFDSQFAAAVNAVGTNAPGAGTTNNFFYTNTFYVTNWVYVTNDVYVTNFVYYTNYGSVDTATNWLGSNALWLATLGVMPTTNGFVDASVTNGLVGPAITNGLVGQDAFQMTNGFVGPEITNNVATKAYAQLLTNGFVGSEITNNCATKSYAQSLTNGFVGPGVTNGLVGQDVYSITNGFVGAGITNGYPWTNCPVPLATSAATATTAAYATTGGSLSNVEYVLTSLTLPPGLSITFSTNGSSVTASVANDAVITNQWTGATLVLTNSSLLVTGAQYIAVSNGSTRVLLSGGVLTTSGNASVGNDAQIGGKIALRSSAAFLDANNSSITMSGAANTGDFNLLMFGVPYGFTAVYKTNYPAIKVSGKTNNITLAFRNGADDRDTSITASNITLTGTVSANNVFGSHACLTMNSNNAVIATSTSTNAVDVWTYSESSGSIGIITNQTVLVTNSGNYRISFGGSMLGGNAETVKLLVFTNAVHCGIVSFVKVMASPARDETGFKEFTVSLPANCAIDLRAANLSATSVTLNNLCFNVKCAN